MALEIERKFLVKDNSWLDDVYSSEVYRQGYIPTSGVAVRVRTTSEKAFLTIKADREGSLVRDEYEYEIPLSDASEMIARLCGSVLEKRRFRLNHGGYIWEIDQFMGDNEGLVIAEIELPSEYEKFITPHWLGEEITDDPRFRNVNLATTPMRGGKCP